MNAPLLLALLLLLGADPSGPVCTSPAATSAAPDEAALRARLAPLFGLIDGPVTPEMWRALPPEALPLLERIASGRGRAGDRARALEGAAALGSDGTLHRRLAADGAAPFPVRAAAIRALGALLPPARLKAELGPLLDADADLRVRAAAASTLARSAPSEGCSAVRARARRESASERAAFAQALRACGED